MHFTVPASFKTSTIVIIRSPDHQSFRPCSCRKGLMSSRPQLNDCLTTAVCHKAVSKALPVFVFNAIITFTYDTVVLGLIREADKNSHRMTVYRLDVWSTTNNLTLNQKESFWILNTLWVMHAALPTPTIKFLDISWNNSLQESRKMHK